MIKTAKMLVEEHEKTGGPAFPFEMASDFDGVRCKGMTLRDYFAAKAMQGLLANGWCSEQREIAPNMGEREVAQDAYRLADAMLEARSE